MAARLSANSRKIDIAHYQFFRKLMKLPYVKEIWLFGSRARGDNAPMADIDLAIKCPKATNRDWLTISDIIDDADTLIKIDCVRFDELDETQPLRASILNQGIKIMSEEKIKLGYEKLKKALIALETVASKTPREDRETIDATIQRYEFTFELFWKFLKCILEEKGIDVRSPRDVLEESYQEGFIENENQWIQMLKDRNMISHLYDEKLADDVYSNIKKHLPLMKETFEKLKTRYHLS